MSILIFLEDLETLSFSLAYTYENFIYELCARSPKVLSNQTFFSFFVTFSIFYLLLISLSFFSPCYLFIYFYIYIYMDDLNSSSKILKFLEGIAIE